MPSRILAWFCEIIAAGLVASCSSPTPKATPTTNQLVTLAAKTYAWPDSLPRYFPAQTTRVSAADSARDADLMASSPDVAGCRYEYEFAARCLVAFQAPVLHGPYAGPPTYRFIWLRSFDRPALLTLTRAELGGGVLRTQFLTKEPGMSVPKLVEFNELGIGPKERERRKKFRQKMLKDSLYLARVAFAKAPVKTLEEERVTVSPAQLRQFERLLAQADYWRLPSCKVDRGILDGAYWFLEVRQAGHYHVVFRHSPDETEKFQQCCAFLLNLSPAKKEERY